MHLILPSAKCTDVSPKNSAVRNIVNNTPNIALQHHQLREHHHHNSLFTTTNRSLPWVAHLPPCQDVRATALDIRSRTSGLGFSNGGLWTKVPAYTPRYVFAK